MKTSLFLLGVGLVVHGSSLAQTPDLIRVKGEAGGVKTIPVLSRYRYSQFIDGRVLYLNGSTASAKLNYNVAVGEMQFIDPHGDTLALADESLIRVVGVGPDVFHYDQTKGYLEIIADYNGVKLAVKQQLKPVKRERMGGYEQSTGSAAITTYQFYSSGNTSVNNLDAKGDLLVKKDKTYFIVDRNNRTYTASKASILSIFAKHREQVSAYLTSEAIDFKQEGDLKKLLKFLGELV